MHSVTVLFLLSSGVALVNLRHVKSPTLQRRHEEENDEEARRKCPGTRYRPGANTFPPGCLLCYILARARMGGLLKRLVVTSSTVRDAPSSSSSFFFHSLESGKERSRENSRVASLPFAVSDLVSRSEIFASPISRGSANRYFTPCEFSITDELTSIENQSRGRNERCNES